eukprot:c4706_g1_i1.p1 GENE.c4706_g1_i1~~c4706_g1_i1.p1  ORF type:complete len:167 (+),score=32.61 c4706_g1_i1:62-562(+)
MFKEDIHLQTKKKNSNQIKSNNSNNKNYNKKLIWNQMVRSGDKELDSKSYENAILLCEIFSNVEPEEILRIYEKQKQNLQSTTEELVNMSQSRSQSTNVNSQPKKTVVAFKKQTDFPELPTPSQEDWVLLEEDFGVISADEHTSFFPNTYLNVLMSSNKTNSKGKN